MTAVRDKLRERLTGRRRVVIGVVAALVVVAVGIVVGVLTSGPSSPGDVTFGAAGAQARTGPAQWCDVQVSDCDDDVGAVARLAVPVGQPVAVTPPGAVAATPWQVVFSFRDASGAEQRGRTPVFAPGTTPTYSLALPDPTARLESVEVQQYGARITQGPNGLEFATRATWVLAAS